MPRRSDSIRTQHLSGIAHGSRAAHIESALVTPAEDLPVIGALLPVLSPTEAAEAGLVTCAQIAETFGKNLHTVVSYAAFGRYGVPVAQLQDRRPDKPRAGRMPYLYTAPAC